MFRPASCQLDKVGEVLVSYLTLTAWSGQIFTFELCNHQLYYELRDCFVSSLISRSSLLSYSGQSVSQSVSQLNNINVLPSPSQVVVGDLYSSNYKVY